MGCMVLPSYRAGRIEFPSLFLWPGVQHPTLASPPPRKAAIAYGRLISGGVARESKDASSSRLFYRARPHKRTGDTEWGYRVRWAKRRRS